MMRIEEKVSLLVFIGFILSLGCASAYTSCQDTDNGMFPEILGILNLSSPGVSSLVYWDTCYQYNSPTSVCMGATCYLKEYYCVGSTGDWSLGGDTTPCANCMDGRCIPVIVPNCTDGIRNRNETQVDCGGECAACPTCSDGIQNGMETGVDCGGACSTCPIAPTSSCSDGIMNGAETGIDCGGSCTDTCVTGNCYDGVQNGAETGVDCGGGCITCTATPTCYDGIKNGIEMGVDCGGSCPACTLTVPTANCPSSGCSLYMIPLCDLLEEKVFSCVNGVLTQIQGSYNDLCGSTAPGLCDSGEIICNHAARTVTTCIDNDWVYSDDSAEYNIRCGLPSPCDSRAPGDYCFGPGMPYRCDASGQFGPLSVTEYPCDSDVICEEGQIMCDYATQTLMVCGPSGWTATDESFSYVGNSPFGTAQTTAFDAFCTAPQGVSCTNGEQRCGILTRKMEVCRNNAWTPIADSQTQFEEQCSGVDCRANWFRCNPATKQIAFCSGTTWGTPTTTNYARYCLPTGVTSGPGQTTLVGEARNNTIVVYRFLPSISDEGGILDSIMNLFSMFGPLATWAIIAAIVVGVIGVVMLLVIVILVIKVLGK